MSLASQGIKRWLMNECNATIKSKFQSQPYELKNVISLQQKRKLARILRNSFAQSRWKEINWVFLLCSQQLKLNYDISHFLKHKITLGRVGKTASSFFSRTFFFLSVAKFNTTIIVTKRRKEWQQQKLWRRIFCVNIYSACSFLVSLHFFSARCFVVVWSPRVRRQQHSERIKSGVQVLTVINLDLIQLRGF